MTFCKARSYFLALALVVLGVRGFPRQSSSTPSAQSEGNESTDVAKTTKRKGVAYTPPPGSSGNLFKDLEKAVQSIMSKMSSGSTVKAADFNKTFGQDTDHILTSLQVTEVSRSGNRVTLKRNGQTSEQLGGKTITIDGTVSFDVVQSSPLRLKNISGVTVDPGPGLPNAHVKEASVATDSSGNSTITLKLRVSFFLPDITRVIKVGPDGKPITK